MFRLNYPFQFEEKDWRAAADMPYLIFGSDETLDPLVGRF